jgi:hypothetical protein
MIFRKYSLRHNISFVYKGENFEIAENFNCLGKVFTTGGFFNTAFKILFGQALKAV